MTAALFLGLWAVLVLQLSSDWKAYPQYSYGWSVPLLTLYLLYRRWQSRPEPQPPRAKGTALRISVALLALGYLPTRLIQEANPDWRMVSWALTIEVVGLSLAAVYYMGGKPWVRHFIFPIAFIAVAVPWSRPAEEKIINGLMVAVASCTVEGLLWCQVPAFRQGNLIEISSGLVGIDEACSGIRSLQATLMGALFLGEIYRFTWKRRALLLALGVFLAFILNIVRAWVLSWIAAREGVKAMGQWHDPAGLMIFGGTVLGLFIFTVLLAGRIPKKESVTKGFPARFIPQYALTGLLIWYAVAEFGTRGWYAWNETRFDRNQLWKVNWPEGKDSLREIIITEPIKETLGFDSGKGMEWLESDGTKWSMFSFRWEDENPSIKGIKYHKPDICFPSAGRKLEKDLGFLSFSIDGQQIPGRLYLFRQSGRPIYVFYGLSEEVSSGGNPLSMEVGTRRSMMTRVLEGKKGYFAQQIIEVFISGLEKEEDVRQRLANFLAEVIRPLD
ncbi:MAG: exosortase/archaeosortase family protein [Verrucomicrobiota bacterium]|nr:exosortase/archaeosortase family protein [Verrucomicrobiota bacterium]